MDHYFSIPMALAKSIYMSAVFEKELAHLVRVIALTVPTQFSF